MNCHFKMSNNNERTIFERFFNFMEHNNRGIEILTYGIAGVGLITAMYKIKPFSKFQKPNDVPYQFIKRKIPLHGYVTQVEMNDGPIIYVDHKPLIELPRFWKSNSLPIKIEGVNVNMNGFSWLQTVAVGKRVNFIPVKRERNALGCIITIPQTNKEPHFISEELIKLGFGTIQTESRFLNDKKNINYKRLLETAQKEAKRRRNGIWHFKIPPTLIWRIQNQIDNQINSILPIYFTKRLSL